MSSASAVARPAMSRLVGWTLIGILFVIWVLPVVWVVMLSFKPNSELMLGTSGPFEAPYTLRNYADTLQTSRLFAWFGNSLIVSLISTASVLVLSSLAGYGFAKTEFPFRRTIFVLVLLGLAIPEQAVIIPRHQLFTEWSLHNTFFALIAPNLALPFGVFLMTQYFRGIGKDIDEAALLDNASRFDIFFKVNLPLTIPAQATLGIFTFLATWNDYLWPLISATKPAMFTLTVGIASTQTNFAQSEGLGYLMAQAVLAGVPAVIVYLLFQKYIVRAASGAAIR